MALTTPIPRPPGPGGRPGVVERELSRVTSFFRSSFADTIGAVGVARERRINDVRLSIYLFVLGLTTLNFLLHRNLRLLAADAAVVTAGVGFCWVVARYLGRPCPKLLVHYLAVAVDVLCVTFVIFADSILGPKYASGIKGAQFDPIVLWYAIVGASSGLRLIRSLAIATGVACGAALASIYAFDTQVLHIPFDLEAFLLTLTAVCGSGYFVYRVVDYSKLLFAKSVRQELEIDFIKRAFSRYVTREVMDKILAGTVNFSSGIRCEVTILFSDIRGFTTMAERMTPEAVFALLNEYFGEMVEAILQFGGTVDKYIGDGIMAVFGAPVRQEDHAMRAAEAAQAMRLALVRLNTRRRQLGEEPIEIGIGLHTGECVIGNIGALDRFDYTAIGDTVNTASRIESATRDLGVDILMSGATYRAIASRVEVESKPPLQVKGKSALLEVYALKGILTRPV